MEDFLFKKLIVKCAGEAPLRRVGCRRQRRSRPQGPAQKAMELARVVYGIVKSFPTEERYALSDQIRRAVVSVPSNIAEGNGRAGDKDYAHFLSIARGSLFEVVTQLELAQSLGFVDDISAAIALSKEVGSMLTAMLRKYGSIHC